MIEISGEGEPQQIEVPVTPLLPGSLPVLPLRESVAFPDTVTPLAVGQERSIRLVNEALGSNRMLVMLASRTPSSRRRALGPVRGGRGGHDRADAGAPPTRPCASSSRAPSG